MEGNGPPAKLPRLKESDESSAGTEPNEPEHGWLGVNSSGSSGTDYSQYQNFGYGYAMDTQHYNQTGSVGYSTGSNGWQYNGFNQQYQGVSQHAQQWTQYNVNQQYYCQNGGAGMYPYPTPRSSNGQSQYGNYSSGNNPSSSETQVGMDTFDPVSEFFPDLADQKQWDNNNVGATVPVPMYQNPDASNLAVMENYNYGVNGQADYHFQQMNFQNANGLQDQDRNIPEVIVLDSDTDGEVQTEGEVQEDQELNYNDLAKSSRLVILRVHANEFGRYGLEDVDLHISDIQTMVRDTYLNDEVVAFMILHIAKHSIKRKILEQTYFFSSNFCTELLRGFPSSTSIFYYEHFDNGKTSLSDRRKKLYKTDETERDIIKGNAENMQNWLKRIDIFEKSFVVIPICHSAHWMLAIICNPRGCFIKEAEDENKDDCYIVFFDGLSNIGRVKQSQFSTLISYFLEAAFEVKKEELGGEYPQMEFKKERIKLVSPKKTPVQNNLYDCGFYMLHYLECFFEQAARENFSFKKIEKMNWAARYPECNKMADLMRDKTYNAIIRAVKPMERERLSRYEAYINRGLTVEGQLQKGRRHSAHAIGRQKKRHRKLQRRHFSVDCPARNLPELLPSVTKPRDFIQSSALRKVRARKHAEYLFVTVY